MKLRHVSPVIWLQMILELDFRPSASIKNERQQTQKKENKLSLKI